MKTKSIKNYPKNVGVELASTLNYDHPRAEINSAPTNKHTSLSCKSTNFTLSYIPACLLSGKAPIINHPSFGGVRGGQKNSEKKHTNQTCNIIFQTYISTF